MPQDKNRILRRSSVGAVELKGKCEYKLGTQEEIGELHESSIVGFEKAV